jgi:hypothetical protein
MRNRSAVRLYERTQDEGTVGDKCFTSLSLRLRGRFRHGGERPRFIELSGLIFCRISAFCSIHHPWVALLLPSKLK